ncbi:uncharacterized protein CG45076-like [Phoenix dactylifera]|uniref:Uncharacterized protein CG45076-like n=1 Tax=Phoenix dactylifera TaxID=42345 RepID=A0A8B9A067_PHODC|nr:uncharacterized protein CG45076-like [Phoenix dactylifera]
MTALPCLAPISQVPGRPPVRPERPASKPGSSREAARLTSPEVARTSPEVARTSLPDPSEGGGRQGRRPYTPDWAVFEGDSALENAEKARQFFRGALLPADMAKIRALSMNQFLDSARISAHLHEVETLISIGADYKERARRSARAQEEAENKLAEAESKLAEAGLQKKELLLRLGATEDEVRLFNMTLEEERAGHALTRSEVRAAEARLSEAQSLLAVREQEIRNLEQKAEQHEAREKAAREQARNAVELFRESEEFRDLLEEEGVNGLTQGFNDFRNQLRRFLPNFDLDLLQPGAGVEFEAGTPAVDEAAEETGSAAEEGSAGAPEAAPKAAEDGHAEALAAEEPAAPGTAEDNRAEP